MSRAAPTWPVAAERLAARLARRARVQALLQPLGLGLLTGAGLALALRLAGMPVPLPLQAGLVALGALVGLAWGWRARRAVPAPDVGAAAWALDRLGHHEERALTAATVPGARGLEAAFAEPRLPPPPTPRLLPPRGVAVLACGLLATGALALLPAPTRDGVDGTSGTASAARVPGGAGIRVADGAQADAQADALARAYARRTEVLRTLGLDPARPVEASEVREALADPARRDAARKAAGDDAALAGLLAEGADGASDSQALTGPARRQALDAAARLRQQAVAARDHHPAPPRTLRQEAIVARYLALLPSVPSESDR